MPGSTSVCLELGRPCGGPRDRCSLGNRQCEASAVNFDPSHLIRMGIDPVRFVEEFAPRIAHVHGKYTEILTDRLYDLGTEQQPTFAPGIFCGERH